MVVRECTLKDVGALLATVHPLLAVPKDYYDIVAARMYSEILGWFRYRVANEFVIVGAIDGVIAGIVTSRHVQKGLGMSLHTLTIKRGLRVGAQLFAAKMEHHIDYLRRGRGPHRRGEPHRLQALDDRVRARGPLGPVPRPAARAGRRAHVHAHAQAVGDRQAREVHRHAAHRPGAAQDRRQAGAAGRVRAAAELEAGSS